MRTRPVTDTIQVDDERDLNSAETFQEKISKGIRDIFGGHKKAAEEPEDMEEDVQDESEDSTEEEAEDVQEGEETPEEETAATEESAESEETDSEDTEEEIPESEDGEELLSSVSKICPEELQN